MAKKNVDVSVLSDSALDDKSSVNPSETSDVIVPVNVSVGVPLCSSKRFLGDVYGDCSAISVSSPVISYPDSVTDQIHALSIADMIRQGQGSVFQEPSDYDLKAGEYDDGSIMPQSMNNLEWADPAQRFETEQRLNDEFAGSISVVPKVSTEDTPIQNTGSLSDNENKGE